MGSLFLVQCMIICFLPETKLNNFLGSIQLAVDRGLLTT